MSALTDRITEVLEQHRPYGLDCKCGEAINSDAWWAAHVTERITALFTEEHYRSAMAPDDCDYDRVRWVFGWTAVEGQT